MKDQIDTNERKNQAKLYAVKLTCPNGHLIYESQPDFWVTGDEFNQGYELSVAATCDACDINERYFTLVLKNW